MLVDWSTVRWRDGELWNIDVSNMTVKHLLDLLDARKRLKAHKQKKKLHIKVAPHHFDEGGDRWAYHARQRVSGRAQVSKMVVKRFRKGPHDWGLYFRQMEVQAIGNIFAHAFNQVVRHQLVADKILHLGFTKVETLRVNGNNYDLELYLPGNYVKYNNNLAYVNHKQFSRTLQTFSHWTYEVTWGKLMVTDLQVVQHKHDFLLSDPAIHYWTNDRRFYQSDKGKEGMYSFFKTHRCNPACKLLDLHPHRLQPKH